MKFLCDQMLARLGRWLRAAGYDTAIIEESIEDKKIFSQAKKEGRLLLTRDMNIYLDLDPEREHVIWLQENSTQECALELSEKVSINWLKNPFSRCLVCNHSLIETQNPDSNQIPEDIRKNQTHFLVCPECKKVYWEGSHTKRMRRQLDQWQQMIQK